MQLSKLLYQSIFWRGVNLFSVFILNIVIARVLGAAAYGSLFFIINFYALTLLIASFSLESGLALYTAKKEINSKSATIFSLAWSLLVSFFIIAVLIATDGIFFFESPELRVYSFLYLAGNLLISFFSALYTAKQHYIVPNAIIALVNIVLCVFLLGLIKIGDAQGLSVFVHWFFISFFVQGLLMAIHYFFNFNRTDVVPQQNEGVYKKIFKYAAKVFLGNLIFFLVYRVDYWMINYFIDDKMALGNYIQVSKMAQVFFIVPGIIAATVFSVTAGGHHEVMKKNVQQLSRIIFTSTIVACILLAIVGKWLFPFLFGATFTQMYIPFLLLIPGIAAIATLYPFTAFYAGINNVHKNIIGPLFSLVVIIAGDIIMIPLFGIAGAASVCSISYIVFEVYILYQFKKQYGLRFSDCFVLKKEDCKLLLRKFN